MNEGLAATASAALSKKAKAAAKKDIRRALKPATAPVKKGIHQARKWFDKATSKVPVLGKFASLPLDVADDLVGGILPEIKSKSTKWRLPKFKRDQKWVTPELVDKLPVKTAMSMAVEENPGPGKKRKSKARPGKLARKIENDFKKIAHKAGSKLKKRHRKGMRGLKIKSRRKMRFNNKRLGTSESGYRMKTTEYAFPVTIDGDATQGAQVFANGILINPHSLNLAELNLETPRWEYYRIRPVVKVDGAKISFLDGSLIGYFDPDPTDTPPSTVASKMRVAKAHGGNECSVNHGGSWKPSSKRGSTVKFTNWFHCDTTGTDEASVRLANQYKFYLMVYRQFQSYAGGAGVPTDVVLNFSIHYEIDFKVRTLDDDTGDETGNGSMLAMSATTGTAQSTSNYFGMNAAWSNTSGFRTGKSYLFNTDGVYREFSGKSAPAYVLITYTCQATTLTSPASGPVLFNLTNIQAMGYVTASNQHYMRALYSVTDPNKTASDTLISVYRVQNGQVTSIPTVAATYSWFAEVPGFATCSTPAASSLTITEIDSGFGYTLPAMLGDATLEGQAWKKFIQIPYDVRPHWDHYLHSQLSRREQKLDELDYWKRKAKSQAIESKEHKLSLTPNPSDDEDDWLAYQQQRAAMHKSPGIIGMRPLKIVQDDEKSEKGVPRPKAGSQK